MQIAIVHRHLEATRHFSKCLESCAKAGRLAFEGKSIFGSGKLQQVANSRHAVCVAPSYLSLAL